MYMGDAVGAAVAHSTCKEKVAVRFRGRQYVLKLFIPLYLCHQVVQFGTNVKIGKVMEEV